ncbi:MAG: hypothetical protein E7163_05195 [Firmicutes bacterium]|nr:hypothetical protein [Bacillota bacterium]
MYISGSLKDKTVKFYKEKMISYNDFGFNTDEVSMGYDGSLNYTPWNNNKQQTLENKQKKYINEGIVNTLNLLKQKYLYKEEVLNLITIINNSHNSVKYILFECLYKLILSVNTNYQLKHEIKRFRLLLEYLNTFNNIYQVNLDIIIKLFLNNQPYTKNDIYEAKKEKFKIDERDITDTETYNLMLLGEFIAPNRVPIIANTLLSNNEFGKYVLPIYFGINDDKMATKFLQSSRNSDIDLEQIEKNAILQRIPSNLININRG